MINSMLPLPGLSPVSGKSVVATFDGGLLSSDGGVLMLREVEQRLRIADRFAGCIEDQRAPDQITHTLAGRCHIVERRTREFCVPNIFKRPRLPRATFP